MLACLVKNQFAPTQSVGGGPRKCHRQHWQDEDLCVPEGVTIVARSRQPFRRDRSALSTRARLQNVEEGKAYRLLNLRITIQLDIRTRPEVVQVGTLLAEQSLPSCLFRS